MPEGGRLKPCEPVTESGFAKAVVVYGAEPPELQPAIVVELAGEHFRIGIVLSGSGGVEGAAMPRRR